VQKDQGFKFVGTNTAITSEFRRDNIKLLPNYTNKIQIHRILPEVNNIGAILDQGNELQIYDSTATITLDLLGANSVGSTATELTSVTMFVDANGNPNQNPWVQFNQNATRVNTLRVINTSTSNCWLLSAATFQVSVVEEDR
jgi:hypothetical protein